MFYDIGSCDVSEQTDLVIGDYAIANDGRFVGPHVEAEIKHFPYFVRLELQAVVRFQVVADTVDSGMNLW